MPQFSPRVIFQTIFFAFSKCSKINPFYIDPFYVRSWHGTPTGIRLLLSSISPGCPPWKFWRRLFRFQHVASLLHRWPTTTSTNDRCEIWQINHAKMPGHHHGMPRKKFMTIPWALWIMWPLSLLSTIYHVETGPPVTLVSVGLGCGLLPVGTVCSHLTKKKMPTTKMQCHRRPLWFSLSWASIFSIKCHHLSIKCQYLSIKCHCPAWVEHLGRVLLARDTLTNAQKISNSNFPV